MDCMNWNDKYKPAGVALHREMGLVWFVAATNLSLSGVYYFNDKWKFVAVTNFNWCSN